MRDNATAKSYAVAVLIITPQGIPLVRDPKKPAPIFWKAPGGRSKYGENAKMAAIREAQEEIGVALDDGDLSIVYEEKKDSHSLILFSAKLKSAPDLKTHGDEGEEIKVFQPEEILKMPNFFPNHRKAFEKILASI